MGSGTAIYSAPLVFTPPVAAISVHHDFGKCVGFTFSAISNGACRIPTQSLTAPTITVNGISQGSLVAPWVTGHTPPLYGLPSSVS